MISIVRTCVKDNYLALPAANQSNAKALSAVLAATKNTH